MQPGLVAPSERLAQLIRKANAQLIGTVCRTHIQRAVCCCSPAPGLESLQPPLAICSLQLLPSACNIAAESGKQLTTTTLGPESLYSTCKASIQPVLLLAVQPARPMTGPWGSAPVITAGKSVCLTDSCLQAQTGPRTPGRGHQTSHTLHARNERCAPCGAFQP